MLSSIKWIYNTIKTASELDTAALCYLYLPHNIQNQTSLKVGVPRYGLGIRIISFFWNMLKALWKKPIKIKLYPQGRKLFFAVTNNQDRVLRTLAARIDDKQFAGINNFGEEQFPLFWSYLISLPFFPLILLKFIRSKGLERKAFHYVFDAYWLSYGFYIFSFWFLQKSKPSLVVLANDHLMWTRVFIKAANAANIKSLYLQHASVTEIFPPLTVDYAFLDGEDAAKKYAGRGPSKTQVFLIGTPHFDKYLPLINHKTTIQSIGVCVGILDEREPLIPLVKTLNQTLPEISFTLRPHPGDPRVNMWRELVQEAGWNYSDGKAEDAFEFLSRLDMILAGDSNILLEAALMNVFPIYYDYLGTQLDWYGFYKNGLVPYFSDLLSVSKFIKGLVKTGRPNIRLKAKIYCDTVGTKYDGCSGDLTVKLINEITNGKIDYSIWQSIQLTNKVLVYKLAV